MGAPLKTALFLSPSPEKGWAPWALYLQMTRPSLCPGQQCPKSPPALPCCSQQSQAATRSPGLSFRRCASYQGLLENRRQLLCTRKSLMSQQVMLLMANTTTPVLTPTPNPASLVLYQFHSSSHGNVQGSKEGVCWFPTHTVLHTCPTGALKQHEGRSALVMKHLRPILRRFQYW